MKFKTWLQLSHWSGSQRPDQTRATTSHHWRPDRSFCQLPWQSQNDIRASGVWGGRLKKHFLMFEYQPFGCNMSEIIASLLPENWEYSYTAAPSDHGYAAWPSFSSTLQSCASVELAHLHEDTHSNWPCQPGYQNNRRRRPVLTSFPRPWTSRCIVISFVSYGRRRWGGWGGLGRPTFRGNCAVNFQLPWTLTIGCTGDVDLRSA